MPPASRKSLLERLKEKESTPTVDAGGGDIDFWDDIYRRIRKNQLVPILGSALRQNRIFDLGWENELDASSSDATAPMEAVKAQEQKDGNGAAPDYDGELADSMAVDEQLSIVWAEELEYPLKYMLPRSLLAAVAQYNRVLSADPDQAKNNYLLFLKKTLLQLAEDDPSVSDQVPELRSQRFDLSFSEIVTALDYPRYRGDRMDPLRVLAKLRLPIYVTTSYFDFMERALRAEGADNVRTQFCLWNMEESSVEPKHRPDPDYKPSSEEPVVYHLFGYERYPSSLVLSEDDYLDFLLAFAQDMDSARPLIPLYLRSALEESSLLLAGYRLQDWDFRVIFRWLINCLHRSYSSLQRMYSVAIHLDPKHQSIVTNADRASKYLKAYFGSANFRVEWGDIDEFVDTFWQEWNRRRKGDS